MAMADQDFRAERGRRETMPDDKQHAGPQRPDNKPDVEKWIWDKGPSDGWKGFVSIGADNAIHYTPYSVYFKRFRTAQKGK